MSALSIAEVVKSIRDLPPLPAVVVDLMNNLNREETGARLLAEKIAQDQALTAKTLRLANSSFYGMQRKVSTIQQAIAIAGFNNIHALVTAASVMGRLSDAGENAFDYPAFWRHSLGTAVCARAIARHARANPDQAFIAGLLHDIGRLVLVSHAPSSYKQVLAYRAAEDCTIIEAEHAVLDLDHARVGKALAEHWRFPPAIQHAIQNHHAPAGAAAGSLVAIVHIAGATAHALDFGGEEDDLVPPISATAWDSLKLDKAFFLQMFRDAEAQTEEAYRILMAV
ncbi:MAG TPA: HDOD domain-containing protein [Paucimonas sp.]|nr:HDOD domain-containing protein [Paucimonas sp.]